MRARYPDRDGFVDVNGVKIFYEVFGEGNSPAVVLIHGWQIAPSLTWKRQVPYLARRYKVVTFDWPGCGRSDRPTDPAALASHDIAPVLDATGVDKAVLVGLSGGAIDSVVAAATIPDRVDGVVLIGGPFMTAEYARSLSDGVLHAMSGINEVRDSDEGWAKLNRHYWDRDFEGFVEFWWEQLFPEPHSTKAREDGARWAMDATRESLIVQIQAMGITEPDALVNAEAAFREVFEQVRCPVLAIHGSLDCVGPVDVWSSMCSELGWDFVRFEGSGHCPHARDPVPVNLLIREFVERIHPPAPTVQTWARARSRSKRALFISSPIGLGHALRDVAIVDELRKLEPSLEVDWLAQHPVTEVLQARGERIHPASEHLVSESAHWESESSEHDLHCFDALRRMDEILVANFMAFRDLVDEECYDLWVADEGWDVDYFLHENPELKTAAYCWLTDFVGFLPMPDGGEREALLTADYNAEMIEQIDEYPRLRDRALFVGNPDDIVPASFGPGLPDIREWTERNFAFPGYVSGFDPSEISDRDALRAGLGYALDEKVCVVTVGGSGVGEHLLRRVCASYSEAKQRVPELRMIVVAGPRIDPTDFPTEEGLEVHGYVPRLYRHLAACDLAVVQGGLTTCMELTAARRPFIYFPLRNHFEQQIHVRHRLERYGSGRCMDYELSTPEVIADAISQEVGRDVKCRAVESDGAARAAELIAELV